MTPDGIYNFDPMKLGINHSENQNRTIKACQEGKNIIIDNTNTRQMDLEPYQKIAQQYGYKISVVAVLEEQSVAFKRNTHNVPENTHKRLHEQLIDSIQNTYNSKKEELPDYIES